MTAITKTSKPTQEQSSTRTVSPKIKNFGPAVEALTEGLKADPSQAEIGFSAHSRQISGLRSEVEVRDFLITVDEPESLGGTDLGPNPVELVLAAIASCQEITYRLYADKLGIPLRGVSVTADGTIDLRGFFAVDSSVRPGFQGIKLDVQFDSDASDQELERLQRIVDAHCPVLDILRNPTPVETIGRRADTE